ncbi:hypothetical protein CON36_32270 [Bacillus cereus]|uniref:DUF218 domain-containing protein n=1 Tax=Bacillus cereus TaxID=1396 RepID=A0A9X6STV4_BACCE|nr:YdcF family protein [Bacillus cereus]PDZ94718.1 hypothetical protein CON36_32270 [Bacillus cereus]
MKYWNRYLSALCIIYVFILYYCELRIDAGMVFVLIIGTCLFFVPKIKKKQMLWRILKICLMMGLVLMLIFESLIFLESRNDVIKDEIDFVIVLGCGLRDGSPSEMLKNRLNKVIPFLEKNTRTKVIVSGGIGIGGVQSEAQVMEKYLIAHGIEKERIIKEEKATSTYENLVFSRDILIKRAYDYQNKHVLIVTSDFHMFRSKLIAKRLEFNTFGLVSRTPIINIVQAHLREYLAITNSYFFNK